MPESEHDTAPNIPRSQVIGTTELLEAILEHLPAKSLFVVQRVSKIFQATILGSKRIQHKMFLRISNDAQIPWAFCNWPTRPPKFEQVSEPNKDEIRRGRQLLTPVAINPSLDHIDTGHGDVSVYLDKGATSKLNLRRHFTEQELKQLSVTKGFISDPHCAKVQVRLSFTLGIRRPTRIFVCSVVSSNEPLIIEEAIAEALKKEGRTNVYWRCDGHVTHHGSDEMRVPQELLDELRQRTGLDVFFRFSDFSFSLFDAVAPTPKQRATVASWKEANR